MKKKRTKELRMRMGVYPDTPKEREKAYKILERFGTLKELFSGREIIIKMEK